MPQHLVAYGATQANNGLTNVPAVQDVVLFTTGNDIVVPKEYAQYWAVWYGGASAARGRIVSAYLRRRVLPEYIEPSALIPAPAFPRGFHMHPKSVTITDAASERVQFAIDNGNVAELDQALVWLGEAPKAVEDDWLTVRATTAASALTANTWTNRTLTLDQNLPPGSYELAGARVESATLTGARFVFPGQSNRPGVLGSAPGGYQLPIFRRGRMGIFGRFAYDQPPTVDLFASAADNQVQIVSLDIRKVA